MISPGNFSPAVRDPRVLNDLFAVNEPLNDDDSFSISNYSDDPLTKTDCKYSSAENFKFFLTTNNAYIFSTFCLNLRSLCNPKNLDNLKCVLESMSSYHTVIGITETWLKENSRDPCTELSNYTFSSKCRSKSKGGGVGLFVRKNLTHWLRDDLSMFDEGCFESIFIEINLGKFNIICGNVYRPPFNDNALNHKFLEIFSLVLDKLKREKKLIFLMGDFNRNLLDPDLQTDFFLDEMFSSGLFPLIDKPTRISTTATLLHNIWTNNVRIHPKALFLLILFLIILLFSNALRFLSLLIVSQILKKLEFSTRITSVVFTIFWTNIAGTMYTPKMIPTLPSGCFCISCNLHLMKSFQLFHALY